MLCHGFDMQSVCAYSLPWNLAPSGFKQGGACAVSELFLRPALHLAAEARTYGVSSLFGVMEAKLCARYVMRPGFVPGFNRFAETLVRVELCPVWLHWHTAFARGLVGGWRESD